MKRRKLIYTITILLIIIIIGVLVAYYYSNEKKKELSKRREETVKEITSHYSDIVIVNNEAELYEYKDNKYSKAGKIGKNEIITLDKEEITYSTEYFKISNLEDNYYIKYTDVSPYSEEIKTNDRYKKYIPFNENIVTKDTTNFYDKDNNLVYTINKSFDLPILIKYDTNTYGVVYNDRLLTVKKEDVSEVKENKNTSLTNTPGIAVLNYHFFYDDSDPKEVADCQQEICHPKSLFKAHLNYIKENDVFTPTMEEYELYIDKKINLPKSILITIDDGWRMQIGIDLLQEYKLNGTVFLITSWWKNEIDFLDNYEYVEFHSHGDNLHNQGVCPGGQGGAIKCLDKTKLLADLALSKKKLNGSHVFCYPFYEYNNYSIEVLKEAGFTMAFGRGFYRSRPGNNKYTLPRYVMTNTTTVGELKSYIG